MKSSYTGCHTGQVSSCSSCPLPPTGTGCTVYPRMWTQWREKCGCGGWRGCCWLAVPTGLAVLVSLHHLLHCPSAPIPGPGRQTCHYREIICLYLCVCACVRVLIQAYLPTLLPSMLSSCSAAFSKPPWDTSIGCAVPLGLQMEVERKGVAL